MSSDTQRFLDQLAAQRAEKRAAPAVPQYNKPEGRQWKALLGQVLEYGDSGFSIVLMKDAKKAHAPYQMRDPEGRVIGEGNDLDRMKQIVMDQARMRDQFCPDPDSLSGLPKLG